MSVSPLPKQLYSRSIVRGTTAEFEVAFVELDGTPLVPEDAQMYPAVSITDTDGIVVDTGVAVSLGDGRWRYSSLISVDATVSTSDKPWRIDWLMVTASGRQAQLSQNFAVIDQLALTPNDRAYTQLVMLGQPTFLTVKFKNQQSSVGLVFVDEGGCSVNMSSSIQYAEYEGWYVYSVETPPWTVPGRYIAMWTSRQTLVSPPQTVVQQIRVPEMAFWLLQPSLRMLIDKLQKKSGHVQAYSDSDMYEYLLRGVDIINATNPVSHWDMTIASNMSPLQSFLILAAAWWGLNAQYILSVDLQFSFSGQTVTLDQDQTGGLDGALSRINEYLQTNLPVTKANLQRQAFAGVTAGRPYSWRHGPYVAKVGQWRGAGDFGPAGMIPIPFAAIGLAI